MALVSQFYYFNRLQIPAVDSRTIINKVIGGGHFLTNIRFLLQIGLVAARVHDYIFKRRTEVVDAYIRILL